MKKSHLRCFQMSLILPLLIVCFGLFAGKASAAPLQPKANWSPCYRELGFPFECASVQVPLDYNDPGVAAISIAMVRLPAGDPSQRIGSLFLNPGGPGGSGVDIALFAGPYLYGSELRARFDIVGFDPRGIQRSTALRCFGNPKQWSGYFTPLAFPTTPEEEAIWQTADQYLVDACDQRGARIIDHMSTADVARDLDMLRQAVGDEKLTYAGYSYGTYLGVTYANLFPDKVRAVVVDGVLDPIAWSTGAAGEAATVPFSTRLRSDAGAMATLNEFFRLCDAGGANCAFSGDSAARYAALAEKLKAAPFIIMNPDGTTQAFGYSNLIGTTLGAMYDSYSWSDFAQFLAAIDANLPPATVGLRLQGFWESMGFINKRGAPKYPNYLEGFPGVACSDSDNPTSYAAWSSAAANAQANYGYFGPLWTWASSVCANWSGSKEDRYTGPFTNNTANPVLVVTTQFDPATRYEGAVTVAGLLPNSRLLTVHGWGHTTLFLSQCADQAVANYLVSGTLPAAGLVCEQDYVPFSSAGTAQQAAGFAARSRFIPALLQDKLRPNQQ